MKKFLIISILLTLAVLPVCSETMTNLNTLVGSTQIDYDDPWNEIALTNEAALRVAADAVIQTQVTANSTTGAANTAAIALCWKSDGSSTATGDWDIGAYTFHADTVSADYTFWLGSTFRITGGGTGAQFDFYNGSSLDILGSTWVDGDLSSSGDTVLSGNLELGAIADVEAEIDGKADKTNVLELDNTTEFTPDADYEPATKKYVDDNAGGVSYWDRVGTTLSPATAGDDLKIGTESLFIDSSSDYVGIGTVAPADPLEIFFSNATGADLGLKIKNENDSDTLSFAGIRVMAQNGDVDGQWMVAPESSTIYPGGGLLFRGISEHDIAFITDNVTATPRMVIEAAGNISIANDLTITGTTQSGNYKSGDGSAGIDTTFTDADGNTITVKDGLIVSKTAP